MKRLNCKMYHEQLHLIDCIDYKLPEDDAIVSKHVGV